MKSNPITSVAYLVFSDLMKPDATLAFYCGCKAIARTSCRASWHLSGLASSVAEKMSRDLKSKLVFPSPPAEIAPRMPAP
jgi:hypothetical protein